MNTSGQGPALEAAPVSLCFDLRVYRLETLQKAALKLSRLASFDFVLRGAGAVEVLARTAAAFEMEAAQLAALYKNEVLDQHLRAIVAEETQNERNLILAYAFSNTRLIPA